MPDLEESYLAVRLQPFLTNVRKRLTRSPKIYFLDTGLVCHLLGINSATTRSAGGSCMVARRRWIWAGSGSRPGASWRVAGMPRERTMVSNRAVSLQIICNAPHARAASPDLAAILTVVPAQVGPDAKKAQQDLLSRRKGTRPGPGRLRMVCGGHPGSWFSLRAAQGFVGIAAVQVVRRQKR